MEGQELREYYKKVCELEKCVEMQKRVIANSRKEYLNAKPKDEPLKALPEEPQKPEEIQEFEFKTWRQYYLKRILILFGVLVAIAGFIIGCATGETYFKNTTLIMVSLFLAIGMGMWFRKEKPELSYKEAKLKAQEEYNNKCEENKLANEIYDIDLAGYPALCVKIKEENKKINEANIHSLAIWKDNSKIITTLEGKLKETENKLASVYEEGIIYPKYRNMVADMTICEYLDTGRCERLEGQDGAYNLYESEIRQNRIIDELTEVNNNLNTIQRNQYYLFQGIQEINDETKKMNVGLKGIWNSTNEIKEIATIQTYMQGIDIVLD